MITHIIYIYACMYACMFEYGIYIVYMQLTIIIIVLYLLYR